MNAKWKNGNKGNKFQPEIILKKIEEIKIADGKTVGFRGFDYIDCITVIQSMIEIDDVPNEISQRLIARGIHEAAKKDRLSQSSVIEAIKKEVRLHLEKPDHRYFLVTTLNIDIENIPPKAKLNDCNINFYSCLPKKYRKARVEAISNVSHWLIKDEELFPCFAIVNTDAKTEHCAVDKMMDAIDLLRGIWNLRLNKSMAKTIGNGASNKAINQIRLDALHTLHNADGSIACNTYWYNTEYIKRGSRVILIDDTVEFTKFVRNKLKSSYYKNEIETALIRYVRALDYQNPNVSFLKLWSLLEYLTSTAHDKYDKTIKRATFHFEKYEYHKQILEHLRQYRNKTVHTGTEENDIEAHIYQLKRYVDSLLHFHIGDKFKFKNLEDAGVFMDLKPDIDKLKNKILLYKKGIKYLGG